MKGSLHVKNGVWHTVISYKDKNGKFKTKWESTKLPERGNKKAAAQLLERRIQEFDKAENLRQEQYLSRLRANVQSLGTADMLFTDYCLAYIKTRENKVSPYVYDSYINGYMKVFRNYFGDKTVMDITSKVIDDFYDHMRGKGIKDKTLRHYSDVLRPVLRHAYKERIIPDNPYENVKPLQIERSMLSFYTKTELDALFKATVGHKLDLAIKMLAHYGLRRSELLGLRWKSIDFSHDSITINHKIIWLHKKILTSDILKSDSSYRTFPLIPYLKEALLKQKEKIEEHKKFFGNTYDNKWNDYVFVHDNGTLIQPNFLTHGFLKILKENGLKHIRLHDLRHSCASLLLANGVNLKMIQEWLGHADFSTTANVYSHLDFSNKIESANILSKALNFDKSIAELPVQKSQMSAAEKIKIQMSEKMAKLGIETYAEYIQYLEDEQEAEERQARKKEHEYDDESCM